MGVRRYSPPYVHDPKTGHFSLTAVKDAGNPSTVELCLSVGVDPRRFLKSQLLRTA
jgi:hypothetical protein